MKIIKNLMIFFAVLFLIGSVTNLNEVTATAKVSNNSSYRIGYLKESALWYDSSGNIYRNSKKTRVEIWNREIVASNGQKLIQIYFLEGFNAGIWGYTTRGSVS